MPHTLSYLPFRKAAVLGAGVMGAQIAAHLANAGLEVILLDIPPKEGPKNGIVEAAFKKILKMKPAPFVDSAAPRRITTGNFEEHFHLLKDAEWVIEAVIEHLAIKQQLMARLEETLPAHTIVSTNTSGLPIHQIAEGRSPAFKKRFLGTHFFNPPRYLKLLEIIPTPDTDPALLNKLKWFGRVHLGKSVVIAKDTPNFIANRIGTYSIMQAIRAFTSGEYTIEEIDALTGTLIGHPKSATFRTADVVGLDTLKYVGENLYQAIPHDESREAHRPPELMVKMVDNGILGAKSRKGFYQKVGKEILSLNPQTMNYEPAKPLNLGDLESLAKSGGLKKRIAALYADRGRAGAFTRQSMLDLIGYAARRVPEIADHPADIDRAMCWGFGWEMGPFQLWDTLGFERVLKDLQAAGITLPQWVAEMQQAGHDAFYRAIDGQPAAYVPGKGYRPEPVFADQIDLPAISRRKESVLFERSEGALLNLGDGVALFEFRSKANTLSQDVVEGVFQAIDYVEQHDFHGLVIGNSGRNFSVGANLGEAGHVLQAGKFEVLEQMTKRFQDMVLRVYYARKPVVTAVQGMVLGGGCELLMHCAANVAALESYIGLVELGAGLIPAGCGSTHLAARAAQQAAGDFPSQVQPFLIKAFETIATAKVSTSAREAIELGYLKPEALIVMNADRRIAVAKTEVLRLSQQGYMPPPARKAILVMGKPARATMEAAAYQMQQGHFATAYDRFLAQKLAYVLTGGELSGPAYVDEQYLLRLEREAFMDLLKEPKTHERVKSILTTNKPLRN